MNLVDSITGCVSRSDPGNHYVGVTNQDLDQLQRCVACRSNYADANHTSLRMGDATSDGRR